MTILDTIKQVCAVVGVEIPTTAFTSTDREYVELCYLANEMASRIGQAHEWTLLRTLKTMTGDGTTTAFALPTDYYRMLGDGNLWSSAYETPLTHIVSTDTWLELDVRDVDYVIGSWTVLGGNIEIKPAMASGVTAKYYYLSKNYVLSGSTPQAAFTADSETFRFDETLLKLGMIWQWRANKGQPYAEDMTNYENLLEREIARDKGSRKIHVGRARMPKDVTIAYPQSITP